MHWPSERGTGGVFGDVVLSGIWLSRHARVDVFEAESVQRAMLTCCVVRCGRIVTWSKDGYSEAGACPYLTLLNERQKLLM